MRLPTVAIHKCLKFGVPKVQFSFKVEVILAIVKQFTGQLPEPVNVRLGRKISSFTTLATILNVTFLIAFTQYYRGEMGTDHSGDFATIARDC